MTDDPAIVGELDMTDGRDRGLLRRMVKSITPGSHHGPWGDVTPERPQRYVKALDYALTLAIEGRDHRGIKGCVETLATIIGQQEAARMYADKNARLDAGKLTDNVGTPDVNRETARRIIANPTAMRLSVQLSEAIREPQPVVVYDPPTTTGATP